MKCARCFEEITVPYHFDGKVFGYTCIGIVNPGKTKKRKDKVHFIQADSFTVEKITPNKSKIRAVVDGRGYIDWDFSFEHARHIIIQNEKAFINAYSYDRLFKMLPNYNKQLA